MTYTDEEIARIVHAANIEIQVIDGDEAPSLPWACEDLEVKILTLNGVHLTRVAGFTPQLLHEAWCAGKTAQGWVYGPTKDRLLRTHPCLVAWERLPEQQQAKDRLLHAITRELAGQRRIRAAS